MEGDARACLLPPLLLQPLVENAIKHGVADRLEGGTVRLTARRRADAIGLLAERAMMAGFAGRGGEAAPPSPPISGARAERYQVVLHVDAATLSADQKVKFEAFEAASQFLHRRGPGPGGPPPPPHR